MRLRYLLQTSTGFLSKTVTDTCIAKGWLKIWKPLMIVAQKDSLWKIWKLYICIVCSPVVLYKWVLLQYIFVFPYYIYISYITY